MELFLTLATFIGSVALCLMIFGVISTLINFLLYGEISGNSQVISGRDVYINGKLVYTCNSNNISVINGRVFDNGKLVYKHKRKFRWEK